MVAQPDLFANSLGERLAESRRYGGGVPPRYIPDAANDTDDREDVPDFSPVQVAEAMREQERKAR